MLSTPSQKRAGPSRRSRIHTWKMEAMSLGQAIWIGACQILSAVFPGTSRSMSTIAAGQLAGMSRASALEFSFFLSIPTMTVATGYDAVQIARGKRGKPRSASHRSTPMGTGRSRHRICRVVHRRLRFGGMVHGLRAQARLRSVCGLPDYCGSAGAGVRVPPCRLSDAYSDPASGTGFGREANWILRRFYCIVGTPASWHNVRALADCGTGGGSVFGV